MGGHSVPPNFKTTGRSTVTQRGRDDRFFVGRQQEMSTLTAAIGDVADGHGRLAMLAGEPGIGKTRTAQELASHAESLGGRVFWGRCSSAQGAPPYWPWVQVIRSYVQGSEENQIRADLGSWAVDIAAIVPEVRALLPDLPAPLEHEPEQARFMLFDSITNFLRSASQAQVLVLVMEDLHWANQPSLLMLEFLARELEGCRLLVVGTYRDSEIVPGHPLNQTLGELAREPSFPQVTLEGLDEQDEGRFIELVSGLAPPAGLVAAVHAMAEGNPLFMTEVVRLLVDSGELGPVSGAHPQGWEIKIPAAINSVIQSRLDRLTVNCQQVLRVAAVTGRDFDLRSLEWLNTSEAVTIETEVSTSGLLELLEEASAARVIEEVQGTVGSYQFSHALIQETLAGQLSSVRRARMHADIGQALEDRFQDDADRHAAEIAYHFERAGSVISADKQARYSLLAGEQALAVHAAEDALPHFENGLAARNVTVSECAVASDEQSAELLFGLAKAQKATLPRNRQSEVENAIKPAFDYYVRAGDVPRALDIADYIGGQFSRGSITEAILTKALELATPGSLRSGRILSRYADMLESSLGDQHAATDALGQALEIAEQENDAAMEVEVLAKLARRHYVQLEYQQCLERCVRAIELSPGVSQPPDISVYWNAVRGLIALGRIDEARPYAARQLELAEISRSRFNITQALHANGFLAYRLGDWETARQFSDRGLEIDDKDARLLYWRSDLENQTGDFSAGDVYLDRILETIRQARSNAPQLEHSIISLTVGAAARITGQNHRFDVATSAAGLILSLPLGQEPRNAQLSRSGLAVLAAHMNDAAAAEEQYSFLKSWPISRTPLNLIDGDRILALLAHAIGDLEAATGHFEDALAFCRKAGFRPELAWICCDYADTLIARGKDGDAAMATSLLEESLVIANSLGMGPLSTRVTGRLESSETKSSATYPDGLTQREVEVLQLICAGRTDREIGEELFISFRTVGNHVRSILNKTTAANRTEAATYATRAGLAGDALSTDGPNL